MRLKEKYSGYPQGFESWAEAVQKFNIPYAKIRSGRTVIEYRGGEFTTKILEERT